MVIRGSSRPALCMPVSCVPCSVQRQPHFLQRCLQLSRQQPSWQGVQWHVQYRVHGFPTRGVPGQLNMERSGGKLPEG